MSNSISGKNVLITGAGNGLGRELAIICSKVAGNLYLVDLSLSAMMETKSLCSQQEKINLIELDLTHSDNCRKKFESIEVDIVIANAGLGGINPGDSFDPKIDRKIFEVNYFGTINTLTPFIPQMISRKKGTLVAIASLAGIRGLPQASSYSASKSAQISLMDSLRHDLGPLGINVITVLPGFIKTRMTEHDAFKMPLMVSAEESAINVIKAIECNKKTSYFPVVLGYLSLLNKFLPTFLFVFIMRVVNPPRKQNAQIF